MENIAQAPSIPGNMIFPELYRNRKAQFSYASSTGDRFGVFDVFDPARPAIILRCIASDAETTGWEHVSVVKHIGGQNPNAVMG